jgi:hypothetical protein
VKPTLPTFTVTSQKLAYQLKSMLDDWIVSDDEVQAARAAVKTLQVTYQKGRPAGQECVFESLLRCRLTADIMSTFATQRSTLPSLLNSSHTVSRHVCLVESHDHLISNEEWKNAFEQAIDEYGRLINIQVPGNQSPCRADLYCFARDGIVSLELKYIGPRQLPNVVNTVAQMRRYRQHKRSLLVVYAAVPLHQGLTENVHQIEGKLGRLGQNIMGLVVRGPEIPRVEGTQLVAFTRNAK